jgi:RNA polymerase sigma-70 factor, ECF subfamily
VLILRAALQVSAAEVAAVLSTSVAAVNSSLQRARTTVGDGPLPAGRNEGDMAWFHRDDEYA